MKVSELTADFVGSWLGYTAGSGTLTVREAAELQAALDSAVSAAADFTGLSVQELDEHEDITMAVLGICNDYLTGNRPEQAERKMNAMSEDILGRHSRNLL